MICMNHTFYVHTYSMQVHYLLSIFLCKHDSPFSHYHNRPKTDTCKTCDALKIQCEAETDEVAASRLKAQLGLRHRKAERTYQQLREDTALAQSSDDIVTTNANINSERCVLQTSTVGIQPRCAQLRYWRWLHAHVGREYCLTWLTRSDLLHSHLIAYSDSCGGQNRNINMVCFWDVYCGKFRISFHGN